jgi:hypothetical protein
MRDGDDRSLARFVTLRGCRLSRGNMRRGSEGARGVVTVSKGRKCVEACKVEAKGASFRKGVAVVAIR